MERSAATVRDPSVPCHDVGETLGESRTMSEQVRTRPNGIPSESIPQIVDGGVEGLELQFTRTPTNEVVVEHRQFELERRGRPEIRHRDAQEAQAPVWELVENPVREVDRCAKQDRT